MIEAHEAIDKLNLKIAKLKQAVADYKIFRDKEYQTERLINQRLKNRILELKQLLEEKK